MLGSSQGAAQLEHTAPQPDVLCLLQMCCAGCRCVLPAADVCPTLLHWIQMCCLVQMCLLLALSWLQMCTPTMPPQIQMLGLDPDLYS